MKRFILAACVVALSFSGSFAQTVIKQDAKGNFSEVSLRAVHAAANAFEFYGNGTVWKLVQNADGSTKFYNQVGNHGFNVKEFGKEIEYEYGSPHVKFEPEDCPHFEPEE